MNKTHRFKKILTLMSLGLVFLLSGCDGIKVFTPEGPVAESQKDLIMYSLMFMVPIVIIVFVAFTYMVVKYRRNRPGRTEEDYKPEIHGSFKIEFIWTAIPILIVVALAIPTVDTLFDLEKPPVESKSEDPLVVYATTADWNWFFSYPEQNIETVNYLHIPTDRSIEFRLSSVGSMTSMWIPVLGGQKYAMAGMQTEIFLAADEPGVYTGRNANFNGEGFALQTFEVHAESPEKFHNWVEKKQKNAPDLTQEKYNKLIKPDLLGEMTFSSTHLQWVHHGNMNAMDYFITRYPNAYETGLNIEQEKEEIKKKEEKNNHHEK